MTEIGPLEMIVRYAHTAEREVNLLKAETARLREEIAGLTRRTEYLERQLGRSRYLRNLWTIRCHKARDNRDMWRTRALQAHGTKRRMRGPTGEETSNAGPW